MDMHDENITMTLQELIEAYPDPEERRRMVLSGKVTIDATRRPKLETIVEASWRIILTPERIEAIKEAIGAMEACNEEFVTDKYDPYIAILKDMIDLPDGKRGGTK